MALLLAAGACGSIGPGTVPRDRSDYGAAVGESWKQQTLLNIVRLRYADFPMFMEVAQVIAGYQVQAGAQAGLTLQNFVIASDTRPPGVVGSASVGASYIDRPTVIYAPLSGNDFLRKLMSPVPPGTVLSLLQSGYAATTVMLIAVDSINDVANGSRRQDTFRQADPQFLRAVDLLAELQRAGALQVRTERGRDGSESSVLALSSGSADNAARIAELQRILRLAGRSPHAVRQGGQAGRGGNEISLVTRSMMQIMLEVGTFADVPQSDIAGGRASPVGGGPESVANSRAPLLRIHSGTAVSGGAHVAVPYKGHWFWVADDDIRSKSIFASIMLLSAVSDVGVRTPPPAVVTVPAN